MASPRNTSQTHRQAALQGLLGYRLAQDSPPGWVALVRDAAGGRSVVFLACEGSEARYGATLDVDDSARLSAEYLDTVVNRWNNTGA